MLVHFVSTAVTLSGARGFIDSAGLPRATPALLMFGRRLMLYLPGAPVQ